MKIKHINLYFFQSSTFSRMLFQLVEKIWQQKQKIQILCQQQEADWVDNMLWVTSQLSFLPHGQEADPFPEKQPVLITTDVSKNLNQASLLMSVNHFCNDVEKLQTYEKVLFVFKQDLISVEYRDSIFIDQIEIANESKETLKTLMTTANVNIALIYQNEVGSWLKQTVKY